MTKTVGCCLHIEAVIEGKGGDESTEGTVYTMKSRRPRTEPWRTAQEEGGGIQGRKSVITSDTEGAK